MNEREKMSKNVEGKHRKEIDIEPLGRVHANEKARKKTKPDIFESHICIKNIAIYFLCSSKNVGYFFLREHALRVQSSDSGKLYALCAATPQICYTKLCGLW